MAGGASAASGRHLQSCFSGRADRPGKRLTPGFTRFSKAKGWVSYSGKCGYRFQAAVPLCGATFTVSATLSGTVTTNLNSIAFDNFL